MAFRIKKFILFSFNLTDMKKIFITGISGSGKSTLAKKLASIHNIPHFDLDDVFWVKKYSEKRSDDDCIIKLKKILSQNKSWIIEGTYGWTKFAADKADLVIWLNFGINLSTYRVIKRWIGRKGDDKENLKELYGLIKYVRAYHKIRPNKICSIFDAHKEIVSKNKHNLIEITNKKQLKKLLEESVC